MTKLQYTFREKLLTIQGENFHPVYAADADFWRLHLDYNAPGMENELGVYSHRQKAPVVSETADGLTLFYPTVVAEDGKEYEIALTLRVNCDTEGKVQFCASIANGSCVRVNELQYPMFEFSRIHGPLEDDTLYAAAGLGSKVEHIHAYTKNCHTEYMAADYKNVWFENRYPAPMSMPWYGVQSGDRFLYLGAHSQQAKLQSFLTGTEPRFREEKRLILTIASYPAVTNGERVECGTFCAALGEDWRSGAQVYRDWAYATWYRKRPHKERARQLGGWQRIILKHQHGEVIHTYDDLVRIYREGAAYGLNMILLFAWWKEGMDNGYPNYQPDEALGGGEKLTQAIREINDLGGTVILYANGHLIDVSTEYYRQVGLQCAMRDIEHNAYQEFYRFSNNATLLRFGHKTFVGGCYATSQWREKVTELADRQLHLGSNGLFFDQISCQFKPCFDASHEHGLRIDAEPQYRADWVAQQQSRLSDDEIFGTEHLFDRVSANIDFIHGCGTAMSYQEDNYPYLFRYVYPEHICSNRFLHDEKPGWRRHLNYAFAIGLIFDVCLWRGRIGSIEDAHEYAVYVSKLLDMRKAYLDYFTEGSFDIADEPLPPLVWAGKYTLNGRSILAVCNNSDAEVTVAGRTLASEQACVIELF